MSKFRFTAKIDHSIFSALQQKTKPNVLWIDGFPITPGNRVFFLTDKGHILCLKNVRYPRKQKKEMKKHGTWEGRGVIKGFEIKDVQRA